MAEERHEEVRYVEDRLPVPFVVRMAIGTIVITLVLCAAAFLLLKLRESQLRPSGRFPEKNLGPPHEVANVREEMFEIPQPVPSTIDRQRMLLGTWGWVDREKGIVRMRIDDAMELRLRQAQAAKPQNPGGQP